MLGSALCALAPAMVPLILARALQGLGGGGLMTLAQATIADVVSPRERGRYAGYFSIVWGGSSVLGPMLGGIVTQRYGWPWIFWINLPLGIMALLVADRALRKLPVAHRRSPIDYAGILLLSGATVALLLILSLGGKRLPWTGLQSLALFAAAVILGGLFLRNQKRSPEPIVPPQFLQDSVIRPVLVDDFPHLRELSRAGRPGTDLLSGGAGNVRERRRAPDDPARAGQRLDGEPRRPEHAQDRPLQAPAAHRHAHRHRRACDRGFLRRPPLAPGAAVALMVVGLGVGPIFPCATVAAQNAAPRGQLGAVSGGVAFSRALGGAIGVAAASALVLGLAAGALTSAGQITSLEDLARTDLSPEARLGVARAFGVMFGAVAAALAIGLAVFARVEDRPLGERSPLATAPGAE